MIFGRSNYFYLFQDLSKVDSSKLPSTWKAEIQESVHNIVKCLEAVIILRLLRLSVYLDEIKTFRIIMETLKSLISPFWSVLCVMYSIFYVYALLGMTLWGGEVTFQR